MSIAVVRRTSPVIPAAAIHRLTEVVATTPAIATLILPLLVAKPIATPAPNLSGCWLYSHNADRSECDGSSDGLSKQFHDEERCGGVVRLTSPSRSGAREVIPKTNLASKSTGITGLWLEPFDWTPVTTQLECGPDIGFTPVFILVFSEFLLGGR